MSAFIAAGSLAVAGCSSPSTNQPRAGAATATAGHGQAQTGVVTETTTKTATVESIDATAQTLMLRYLDGSVTGYVCRPEVRNFDQIKIGDTITFTETEETAVYLGKGGGLATAPAPTSVERAPLGAKPGGKIVAAVTFKGRVVSVNPQKRELTLRTGAAGVLRTVKVSPNIDLAKVKTGEDASLRVTQTSVITVETP
jgi:hypothetical protein